MGNASKQIDELTQQVLVGNVVAKVEMALKDQTVTPEDAMAIMREVHQHEEEGV